MCRWLQIEPLGGTTIIVCKVIHQDIISHCRVMAEIVLKDKGRGGRTKSSQNPGIAKIGLTPPPRPPILALWWI